MKQQSMVLIVLMMITMIMDVQAANFCDASGECPGLGDVFYLPKVNIYEATQQTSGQRIFINKSIGRCARTAIVGESKSTLSDFEDKNKLTREWSKGIETPTTGAGSSGINLGYAAFTLEATVNFTASGSLNSQQNYKAVSLDKAYINRTVSIQGGAECYSRENLEPSYLQAFESLALIDNKDVGNDSGWQAYVDFLQSFGSHIQQQQTQGSRILLWESTNDTETVTTDDIKAKVCFDLGYVANTIGACSAYDDTRRTDASTKNIKKKYYVLGGNSDTRNTVLSSLENKTVTSEQLENFIKSGKESDQPIGYNYIPVWNVLKQIYQPLCNVNTKDKIECHNLQRALNLQAAYEGYLVWACFKQTEKRTNTSYQQMIAKTPNTLGISTYACREAKAGCRNDKDCTTNTHLISTSSFCEGLSCITSVAIPNTSAPVLYKSAIKALEKDKGKSNNDKGVNASCSNTSPYGCQLDWSGGAQERDIWLQTTNGPGEGNITEGLEPIKKTGSMSSRSHVIYSSTGEDVEEIRDTFDLKVIVRHKHVYTKEERKKADALWQKRRDSASSPVITVTSADKKINCPTGFCSSDYPARSRIVLRVNVPKNYNFIGWKGEVCEEKDQTSNTCTIKSIKQDLIIHAIYE